MIDLTNFDQDLKILEDLITNIVKTALSNFLGGEAGSIAYGLAVILGIVPPEYPNGTWPVSEMLINTTEALEALVRNPLAALGSYYTRCVTTLDKSGQPIWKYLLPYFAQVMGGKPGQLIPDEQTGTADEPWQVELLSFDEGPAVYLQAWQPGAQSSPLVPNEICLALYFGVPITIHVSDAPPPLAEVVVNVGLQAQLLNLTLPEADGSGSFGTDWLPGVAAQLRVTGATSGGAPSPLKTPSLAGVSVQVNEALVSTGWDRRLGFNWAASIVNAQLNYDGSSSITIPELEFSSGSLSRT